MKNPQIVGAIIRGIVKITYQQYITILKGNQAMKKCERNDCGSWTNILYENKCKVTTVVPDGKCPYFMDKIEKHKVEKHIRKARNEGM